MGTSAFSKPIAETSPDLKARMASICWGMAVVTAVSGEAFLRGGLGFEIGLISISGMMAVTLLLGHLFRAVNKQLAVLAAGVSLVGLLLEAIRLNPAGVDVAVALHGVSCLLFGYLAFRATFLPRVLGASMALAGLSWLTFLSPSLMTHLSPYNLAAGFFGEGSTMLWLLVMGVDVRRWAMQAAANEFAAS